MTTCTITRRSRNLRFGWTSQTEQTAHGLRVQDPVADSEAMNPSQIMAAYQEARRVNSGNEWRWVVTVGGRRVTEDRDMLMTSINMLVHGESDEETLEVA